MLYVGKVYKMSAMLNCQSKMISELSCCGIKASQIGAIESRGIDNVHFKLLSKRNI